MLRTSLSTRVSLATSTLPLIILMAAAPRIAMMAMTSTISMRVKADGRPELRRPAAGVLCFMVALYDPASMVYQYNQNTFNVLAGVGGVPGSPEGGIWKT